MKIEAGKTYLTREGNKVRIVCDDRKGTHSVIGLMRKSSNGNDGVVSFTATGRYHSNNEESKLDLVEEYSFWNNVEVDTPIYVRNSDNNDWLPRYFAKYEDGMVHVWAYGATLFSAGTIGYMPSYKQAKLAKDKK